MRKEDGMWMADGAIAGVGAQDAFLALGALHASGRDAAPDLVEAHKWFNIAAAHGCAEAARRRAELAAEMSADDVARAQRAARLWLTRH